MTYLTSPLLNLGELYGSYWYLIDFGLLFAFFFYALTNEKTASWGSNVGVSKKLLKTFSVILTFSMIMLEWQVGKNLGDVASFALVFVALITWRILWHYLRDFSKDFTKDGKERKISTGIIAAILVLAFLNELFTAEVLTDSFAQFLSAIFIDIGGWIRILLAAAVLWVVIWMFSSWKSKRTPGGGAEYDEGRLDDLDTKIGEVSERLDTATDDFRLEIDRLEGKIDTQAQEIAGLHDLVTQIQDKLQEAAQRFEQIEGTIDEMETRLGEAETGTQEAKDLAQQAEQLGQDAIDYADGVRRYLVEEILPIQHKAIKRAKEIAEEAKQGYENLKRRFGLHTAQIQEMKKTIGDMDKFEKQLAKKLKGFKDKASADEFEKQVRADIDKLNKEKATLKQVEDKVREILNDEVITEITRLEKEIKKQGDTMITLSRRIGDQKGRLTRYKTHMAGKLGQMKKDITQARKEYIRMQKELKKFQDQLEELNKNAISKQELEELTERVGATEGNIKKIKALTAKLHEDLKVVKKYIDEEESLEKEIQKIINEAKSIYAIISTPLKDFDNNRKQTIKEINACIKHLKKEPKGTKKILMKGKYMEEYGEIEKYARYAIKLENKLKAPLEQGTFFCSETIYKLLSPKNQKIIELFRKNCGNIFNAFNESKKLLQKLQLYCNKIMDKPYEVAYKGLIDSLEKHKENMETIRITMAEPLEELIDIRKSIYKMKEKTK